MQHEATREMIELYEAMSQISEQQWSARWISGLDNMLWEDLDSYPEIEELSKKCNGWIVWVDRDKAHAASGRRLVFLFAPETGAAWIGMSDWLELNKYKKSKTMPSGFWPSGVEIPAVSPMQILNEARSQWEEESGERLSLEFRSSEDMLEVLIVAPGSGREQHLFWIEQVAGFPYPCLIACEMEDRIDCTTQGEFREALKVAMNWSHVRSAVANMLIWIEEDKADDLD